MTQPAVSDVRKWAQSVGIPVASRGRLAPEVRLAFDEAHRKALVDVPSDANLAASGEVNTPRSVRVAPAVGATTVRTITARRS